MEGEVRASRFSLIFEGAAGQPSEDNLLAAGDVVLRYLEDFFTVQFQLNDRTNFDSSGGPVTRTDVAEALAEFDVSLFFSADSAFTPKTSDVDNLLFAAFKPPFVDELLTLLGSDLSDNPLSSTSNVVYSLS